MLRNPVAIALAAALLVAVSAAGGLWAVSASDTPVAASPTRSGAATLATVTPAPSTAGRPAGTVCDGTFYDPDPSDGREFAPFYTKKRVVLGLAIVGGPGVDLRAFDVAEATVKRMFANNGLEEFLIEQGAYIVIAEADQQVLDLPEFSCLSAGPGSDFFTHVCGVADHADYPVATVNELDLLGDTAGPCGGINILYHELGHLVYGWALDPADYFDARLLYSDAMAAGRYEGMYAATNYHEYFAEGTQVFFDRGDEAGRRNRDWLARYDPDLYALLASIYGEE